MIRTARRSFHAALRRMAAWLMQTRMPDEVGSTKSRLLVVDDEAMVRDVLAAFLGGGNREVEFAEDGEDALEKFKRNPSSIVLTDRAMPGLNGEQLAEAIKAIAPGTKIIMMTGYGDYGMGEKPASVDLVLGKPFTLDSLQSVLARASAL